MKMRSSFGKRLKTMLCVDFRRMFTMPLLYIIVGSCLVIPILILVMTTMMDGSVSVNPQTGAETVLEGFYNTWQIIGSVSGAGSAMAMDMAGMCNINLLYFFVAVLVCIFVAEDFRSGYAKNLFTVRPLKSDYIVSKTLVCFIGGALMLAAFFVGSLLGGAISGLSFEMSGFGISGLIMCLGAKLLLMAVFVALYLLWSVIAKQRLWLSLVGALCTGMFLFMMIPLLSPLDSTAMNVLLCLAGGVAFGAGLGTVSTMVLKKRDLL